MQIQGSPPKEISKNNNLEEEKPSMMNVCDPITTTEKRSKTTTMTKKRSRYGNTKHQLGPHFKPTENTVICGRSREFFEWKGNCQLRQIVKMSLDSYTKATAKHEKSTIVSSIVQLIRSLSPEGGFVKYHNGQWYEVSDAYAREKVGAQFRDFLPTNYRSSTKSKYERKKRQHNRNKPILSLEQETPCLQKSVAYDIKETELCLEINHHCGQEFQCLQSPLFAQEHNNAATTTTPTYKQEDSSLIDPRLLDEVLHFNNASTDNTSDLFDVLPTVDSAPGATTSFTPLMFQNEHLQKEEESSLSFFDIDDQNQVSFLTNGWQ